MICKFKKLIFIFLLPIALTGCFVHSGVYHEVEKGQTLWRICWTYDVDIQDVAELNNITDQTQIKVGQKLFIPGVLRAVHVEPYYPSTGSAVTKKTKIKKKYTKKKTVKKKYDKPQKIKLFNGKFSWPVKGKVVKNFGMDGTELHPGIDIASTAGAKILASQDGKVVYAETSNRGLGNIIILEHKGKFYTLYGHNKKNLVTVGTIVRKGEAIALVGRSGYADSDIVHFEVREGRKKRNPVFFLPK